MCACMYVEHSTFLDDGELQQKMSLVQLVKVMEQSWSLLNTDC